MPPQKRDYKRKQNPLSKQKKNQKLSSHNYANYPQKLAIFDVFRNPAKDKKTVVNIQDLLEQKQEEKDKNKQDISSFLLIVQRIKKQASHKLKKIVSSKQKLFFYWRNWRKRILKNRVILKLNPQINKFLIKTNFLTKKANKKIKQEIS